MTKPLWVKSAIVAVAAAFILAVPATATAAVSSVSGSAFGVQGNGLVNVAATPSVLLPPSGSGGVPITASVITATVPNFLTTGAVTVSTNGNPGPTGSATSSSTVSNLALLAGPVGITATTVRSDCSSTEAGSTGSTTLENAVLSTPFLPPVTLDASPPPNTSVLPLVLAPLGIVLVLNQQTVTSGPGGNSITVNAIHLTYSVAGAFVEDIIIGQSHCDVTTGTTAVKLQSFVAAPANKGVALRWRTASEAKTLGFNVYRLQGSKPVKVNSRLIVARGSAGVGHSYSLVDRNATRTPVMRYRLQEVQRDGSRVWLASTSLAG